MLLTAVTVAGLGIGGVLVHARPDRSPVTAPAPVVTLATTTTLPQPTFVAAPLVARATEAAVDVDAVLGYEDARSAGTGIVLTPDGEVLTNNHVIDGATSISVTDIGNGRTYPATVVGYSVREDVAVLQLEGASGLATIPFDTSSARLGAPVVAVGNAGGTGGIPATVTGRVTAVGQSISASDELSGASERLAGLIETDAAIKAGDSGGPLIDAYGRIIGMDTAASTGFVLGSDTTQGFAIPAQTARRVELEILDGTDGPDVHIGATAFLGVLVTSYNGALNAPPSDVVVNVAPGSPADQVGVLPGDIISSIDGDRAGSPTALAGALLTLRPSQVVRLSWHDAQDRNRTATVTLASGPPQ